MRRDMREDFHADGGVGLQSFGWKCSDGVYKRKWGEERTDAHRSFAHFITIRMDVKALHSFPNDPVFLVVFAHQNTGLCWPEFEEICTMLRVSAHYEKPSVDVCFSNINPLSSSLSHSLTHSLSLSIYLYFSPTLPSSSELSKSV